MVDWPPTSVPRMAPQTIQEPERPPVVKLFASFTLRPERMLTASKRPTVRRMPMICTGVSIGCRQKKTAAKILFFYDIARFSAHDNLVGEEPSGVAGGTMPGRNSGQGDGLNPDVACPTAEGTGGEGPDFRDGKVFWVVGMEGVYQAPVAAIVGDIEIDGLRKENPRKGEVKEVEPDLVERLAAAEVNDGIEGVAIEAEPRVPVVEDTRTAVGEGLRTVGLVAAVRLRAEAGGTMACKVRLEAFGQEIVDVGAILLKRVAHLVKDVKT